MTSFKTTSPDGKRVVVTSEQGGRYSSRLYVNTGETATALVKKAVSLPGARKQATALLSQA